VPDVHPSAELYPWISAGAIAWGVMNCFYGYRIFKLTVALLGALAGAIFGQAAGLALGLGPVGEIGGLITGGLVGAGLGFLLFVAAVFVAGFGLGATLGILFLSRLNPMVALMSGCVLGLIGGILAVYVQRVVTILATALLGALGTMLAVSYFSQQIDWLFYCRQPQQLPALIDNTAWMFPAILGLASVGVVAQFGLDGGGKKKARPADE